LTRIDPRLPIIAATHLAKIAKSGVASVLTKPYTADHLLQIVAQTLAKRSSRFALSCEGVPKPGRISFYAELAGG
jgi:DNA-binding NtrC family response regulator